MMQWWLSVLRIIRGRSKQYLSEFYLGQRLPFGKTGGVCDGNILVAEGLPTIDTLGVVGGKIHTVDEYIRIDSLTERVQLAALFIMNLAEQTNDLLER